MNGLDLLNGLDLFSGIGGISIALEPWVKTVAYCERDRYAQSVLLSRMAEGELHRAPIWDDVQTLAGNMLPPIDIIFGGFPCQDISAAGRGAGLAGKRSGLFFEIVRLVEETRPSFVFLENVPAIRTRGLAEVVRTLSDLRYDCRWTCVSAAELGAPHLRKRWFLLAYAVADSGNPREERFVRGVSAPLPDENCEGETAVSPFIGYRGENVANAMRTGFSVGNEPAESSKKNGALPGSEFGGTGSTRDGFWAVEPQLGRVAHGIPKRVDRLRCLGNAVVPAQAREAFIRLAGLREVSMIRNPDPTKR